MYIKTKFKTILYVFLAITLLTVLPGWSAPVCEKIKDTLVDELALTIKGDFGQSINGQSFQQDMIAFHEGYQYLAYYDEARHVCVARREYPKGEWQILRLLDYEFKSNDAHNTISMGICPKDGTIHLAFDHHGHPLHYRVSRKEAVSNPRKTDWEPDIIGPVKSELEKGKPIKITYPRFFQTPDRGLQFCYRRGGSGNGDRMLVDYDPESGTWKNTRQIDSGKGTYGDSDSRCSYPNGYNYDPRGWLHTTWVWREGPQTANHDLIYAYSDDEGVSWFNNAGMKLAEPPNVNSPDITVVKIPETYGLMNTHGQYVDTLGRIHAVMWHCSDESLKAVGAKPGESRWGPEDARHYHHYWRDHNAVWHHTEMAFPAGGRPKLFMDKDNNAYIIYNYKGDLVIANAMANSSWREWQIIHTEPGPFVNEMLGDFYLWKSENILSVVVQMMPKEDHASTPLRVIDFGFRLWMSPF